MQLGYLLDDIEAETPSGRVLSFRRHAPVVLVEDVRKFLGWNPVPLILDNNRERAALRLDSDFDRGFRRGILDSVAEQVLERYPHPIDVDLDRRAGWIDALGDRYPLGQRLGPNDINSIFDQLVDRISFTPQDFVRLLQAADRCQVVYKLCHFVGAHGNLDDCFMNFGWQLPKLSRLDHRHVAFTYTY